MKTFKEYTIPKYKNDIETYKGNFVRDLELDEDFPEIYRKREGLIYLKKYGADTNYIDAFLDLWYEYKSYRTKEIKKIKVVKRVIINSDVYILKDNEKTLYS